MENQLSTLDLSALKELYEKELAELNSKLLSGALWHELNEQKKKVTELSILMHKKLPQVKKSSVSSDGSQEKDKTSWG